ncbi:helix-turn-helix domain-containing protein [Planctomycetes bacterium K23_9]|uniref:Transcriptional activator FtrA n=1 Tax=Stieleria marina TaxID=1930275 RepID=A0A517NU01_9BACT|nr:transcriptional activator FtrA [Planctomycetes bacterium K23_9]
MIDPLLEIWESVETDTSSTMVVPDGCRDLIGRSSRGQPPSWFVSSVDDCARRIATNAGDSFLGFRLKPGTSVDCPRLLKESDAFAYDIDTIATRIRETCSISLNVAVAMTSLASSRTVKHAANQCGVGPRTLQRLVLHETGRPPQFWLQLARIRRAARGIATAHSFADLAYDSGFSDQAHMTRQFRRWLAVTPTQFASSADLQSSIHQSGYG